MNEPIEENTKPYVPSYLRIYVLMVVSSWWDVIRYIFSIRRPDQPAEQKKFGLLLTIVTELAKIVGSLMTILVAVLAVIIMGLVWPLAAPVVDIFLAYIVLTRIKRQAAESVENAGKLAEDIAEK